MHSSWTIPYDPKNAAILVALRRKENNKLWGVIGGSRLPNETDEQCALRETFEEIGWNLNPEDLERSATLMSGDTQFAFFVYEMTTPHVIPESDMDHSEYRWQKIAEIDKLNLHYPLLSYWRHNAGAQTPYLRPVYRNAPQADKQCRWMSKQLPDDTLGLFIKDKIIGTVSITRSKVLHSLHIEPEYRSQGFGTHLVKCLMQMQPPQQAFLPTDNPSSRVGRLVHFFEQFNFVQADLWRDLIVMEKN